MAYQPMNPQSGEFGFGRRFRFRRFGRPHRFGRLFGRRRWWGRPFRFGMGGGGFFHPIPLPIPAPPMFASPMMPAPDDAAAPPPDSGDAGAPASADSGDSGSESENFLRWRRRRRFGRGSRGRRRRGRGCAGVRRSLAAADGDDRPDAEGACANEARPSHHFTSMVVAYHMFE